MESSWTPFYSQPVASGHGLQTPSIGLHRAGVVRVALVDPVGLVAGTGEDELSSSGLKGRGMVPVVILLLVLGDFWRNMCPTTLPPYDRAVAAAD